MSEAAPLFFEKRLGGLYPVNDAAVKAVEAVAGRVRVKITRTHGNNRRIALYWIVLGIAAPMLDEQAPGLTDELLHRVLKDRYGLVRIVKLPSGEEVKDYGSIGFGSMTEPERARYVDWAFATLGKWLGCEVTTLTREGEMQLARAA